ncbi:LacI family DNA-binding transcriptional regulator [Phycicoccus sp. Soil802]|uniref:LacI family DNA-binding transcriptional regulator n=1 Tax=Phycicoccus sp. Soil802 TaxID=1736414 RepID=UPI000A7C3ECC
MAGVSFATVSRVLNAEPHVREETRLRVKRAVALLGYERNEAAAQLRRGAGS